MFGREKLRNTGTKHVFFLQNSVFFLQRSPARSRGTGLTLARGGAAFRGGRGGSRCNDFCIASPMYLAYVPRGISEVNCIWNILRYIFTVVYGFLIYSQSENSMSSLLYPGTEYFTKQICILFGNGFHLLPHFVVIHDHISIMDAQINIVFLASNKLQSLRCCNPYVNRPFVISYGSLRFNASYMH